MKISHCHGHKHIISMVYITVTGLIEHVEYEDRFMDDANTRNIHRNTN